MIRGVALTVPVAVALAAPPVASADVLVSAIPKVLVCGDAISPGIFAQPGTRGSRVVDMSVVDIDTGIVWWRKTARATTRWRSWYLPSGRKGYCGATTVSYHLRGRWTVRYKVRFKSEGVAQSRQRSG